MISKKEIKLIGNILDEFPKWLATQPPFIRYPDGRFWDVRHFVIMKATGWRFGFFMNFPKYRGFTQEWYPLRLGHEFIQITGTRDPLHRLPEIENPSAL